MRQTFHRNQAFPTAWFLFGGVILILTLTACSSSTGSSSALSTPDNPTLTEVFRQALFEATRSIPTATITPTPSPSATLTVTPVRTPQALPSPFITGLLNPLDTPHTYIRDTCQYLRDRWAPGKSPPGTVVMPIMFHSITDGEVSHPYQITHAKVSQLLRDLQQQGFEAISMEQLAGFLQHNEKIPFRSVLLIVDDLHSEAYYRDHFEAFLRENHWVLTNAWISEPEASQRVLAENQTLQNEGWVDHQAHGVVHNININEFKPGTMMDTPLYGNISAEQFTRNELEGSMHRIADAFGKAPIAYIWPGGNFSKLGVQIAREVGYQLGFTVNPRGPLMYNWIPLADSEDPARPSFRPEGYVQDPLMVLPRYWDQDASFHIDTVRQISKQAADAALQTRSIELEYYDWVCRPQYGSLDEAVSPSPAP